MINFSCCIYQGPVQESVLLLRLWWLFKVLIWFSQEGMMPTCRRWQKSATKRRGTVPRQCSVYAAETCSLYIFHWFILHFTGDLTDEEDVRRIFHSTLSFFGRIDVLINNAGILEQGSIESTSLDQLDRMMKTNVRYIPTLFGPHSLTWFIKNLRLFETLCIAVPCTN